MAVWFLVHAGLAIWPSSLWVRPPLPYGRARFALFAVQACGLLAGHAWVARLGRIGHPAHLHALVATAAFGIVCTILSCTALFAALARPRS